MPPDANTEWDAVIVGGGPAGATLAALLAGRGWRVVVLERAVFPRDKLCGGLVTEKTLDLVREVFSLTPADLAANRAVTSEAHRCAIWYKSRRLAVEESDIPFRFVSRRAFDKLLLDRAVAAGATLVEGDRAIRCDPGNATVTTAAGREYTGRCVVGADGVGSIVRRSLPPGTVDLAAWRRGLAACAEVTLDRRGPLAGADHPAVYFGVAHYGYGWVFPRSETQVTVGLGALPGRNARPVRGLFLDFLSLLGVSPPDGTVLSGHAVPYGNYLLHPGAAAAMLIGDAAGLADPLFGEGIYFAMRSAQLAAEAIASAADGPAAVGNYLRAHQAAIVPIMRHILRKRWVVFTSLKWTGTTAVRAYLKANRGKLPRQVHDAPGPT